MGLRKLTRSRFLFLIVPIFLILAIGVFSKTAQKTSDAVACQTNNFQGVYDAGEKLARFDEGEIVVPGEMAEAPQAIRVLGTSDNSRKWIEVDLSDQKLKAWDGNSLFLETPVSSGLPWWPTPQGEFRIWIKLRYTRMEGGTGRYYYNLPNVPYVMYFEGSGVPSWKGYGLHGTYWHNSFGTPRSHGCVNLPTPIAERLYWWVGPELPPGKSSVYASEDNPGTRIVIHE